MQLYDRKSPWLSLSLLFLAFFTFGWIALESTLAQNSLATGVAIAAGAAIILAATFSVSLRSGQALLSQFAQTDARSFLTVIFGAFVGVVLLSWIEVTTYIVVLFAAEALAKLELRTTGVRPRRAFGLTALVGLLGVLAAIAASVTLRGWGLETAEGQAFWKILMPWYEQ